MCDPTTKLTKNSKSATSHGQSVHLQSDQLGGRATRSPVPLPAGQSISDIHTESQSDLHPVNKADSLSPALETSQSLNCPQISQSVTKSNDRQIVSEPLSCSVRLSDLSQQSPSERHSKKAIFCRRLTRQHTALKNAFNLSKSLNGMREEDGGRK